MMHGDAYPDWKSDSTVVCQMAYEYPDSGKNKIVLPSAVTRGTLPTSATKITTGTYSSTWKDQLLSWNGVSMTYDGCGNMLTKGSTAYTWTQGRKLSAVENGKSIQYYYDHTGARVQKDVDGTVTEYRMAGKLIVSEKTGSSIQWYHYDSAGNPYAADIGGVRYYFLRNLQGDVVGLIDASGNQVVEYQYDSWGNTVSITGSLADTVGQKNPFRYRGYYYDTETGLYYVGSRYYDAGIRRFISADDDAVLMAGYQNLAQYNLYAYCWNNPANMTDVDGNWPKLSTIFNAVTTAALAVAAVSVVVAAVAVAAPAIIATGGAAVSAAAIASTATIVAKQASVVAAVSTVATITSNKVEKKRTQTYSVYFLKDKNKRIQYVGRVTDYGYKARMAYHQSTRGLTPAYRIAGLSYAEARGLEEIGMIECHTLNAKNPINNRIHGISYKNKNGALYMNAACDYLFNRAENWVLNIF